MSADCDLWHVSENATIVRFEPRLPPGAGADNAIPVVWAVDDAHLAHYLVPRDCPRIALRRGGGNARDIARFFPAGSSEVVLYLEDDWREAVRTTAIWCYALPRATFRCVDANAGYFTSNEAVEPTGRLRIESPLAALRARDVEVRWAPRMRDIAAEVTQSSLAFSIIRLRNARK